MMRRWITLEKLETLLEKQRLMSSHLIISNMILRQLKMKNHMYKTVSLMGFPEGTDMGLLFSFIETIDNLRKEVDQ